MSETVTVSCDGCGAEVTVTARTSRQTSAVWRAGRVDEQLIAAGWLVEGAGDFCPRCYTVDRTPRAPQLRVVREIEGSHRLLIHSPDGRASLRK